MMEKRLENRLLPSVTVISNDFIDHYMAEANGEYVKVYLYLVRHWGEGWDVAGIADALNHTESDVRRALNYWEKQGILAAAEEPAREVGEQPQKKMPVRDLAGDEEFSQLLYIAQKYLNKTFTPRDCDVFANLYGSLGMPAELLEYLVESCAQNGHTSTRYIEKVGLSWHERGYRTAEEAKAQSQGYKKDIFAVMKAFGISGRNPADSEIDLMDKWFGSYGFTREIAVEACRRTMTAIHTPSFQYADRILTEWKEAGVRTMADVEELTKKRKEQRSRLNPSSQSRAGKERGQAGTAQRGRAQNRFHNLEEHGYDYDQMVWNMMNTGGGHGSE